MSSLQYAQNVPLSRYSTMRLGGSAAYAVGVASRQEVAEAYNWAGQHGLQVLVVGSGSNIVWRDEGFAGLLIVNQIKKFELYQEDPSNCYVTIGAGNNWDQAVADCVAAGLTGVECLSLIPGTAGATPVQNVGAYGQDISQTLSSLEAYDTQADAMVTIPASDCDFSYRSSRFKTTDRGRYCITAITLHVTPGNLAQPFYPALQTYLEQQQISDVSPQSIRQAVIAIRSSKLPDPNIIANNGSFFANPIITDAAYVQIDADYDNIPHWPVTDTAGKATGQIKLSAAWLLDQSGFKNVHDIKTGMATWPHQTLVLVNESAHSTADLLAFKQTIITAVQQKFGITLDQEPELLPHLL